MTTVGMLRGGGSRRDLNVPGHGPQAVITDLGILEPDSESGELVLTRLHPGVTAESAIEATSWPLRVAESLARTDEPSQSELEILRALVPSEESNVADLIPSTADLE
jgi:glutaconate CoA-transferase subunit B